MNDIDYIEGTFAGLFSLRQKDIVEQFKAAKHENANDNLSSRDYDGLGGTGRIDHELGADPIHRARIERKKANDNLPKLVA